MRQELEGEQRSPQNIRWTDYCVATLAVARKVGPPTYRKPRGRDGVSKRSSWSLGLEYETKPYDPASMYSHTIRGHGCSGIRRIDNVGQNSRPTRGGKF